MYECRTGPWPRYLPPYSPELNRIEILWKQAKYFWRRFVGLKGSELLSEAASLMKGFGTAFTNKFRLTTWFSFAAMRIFLISLM
ncbi:transposase [Janthinobacterium sp. SUN073]|uniref:transposase n=1 Tax=Janthinobacterium sp. SUN073 TaxID=3004102 RepID=UPI00339D7598